MNYENVSVVIDRMEEPFELHAVSISSDMIKNFCFLGSAVITGNTNIGDMIYARTCFHGPNPLIRC